MHTRNSSVFLLGMGSLALVVFGLPSGLFRDNPLTVVGVGFLCVCLFAWSLARLGQRTIRNVWIGAAILWLVLIAVKAAPGVREAHGSRILGLGTQVPEVFHVFGAIGFPVLVMTFARYLDHTRSRQWRLAGGGLIVTWLVLLLASDYFTMFPWDVEPHPLASPLIAAGFLIVLVPLPVLPAVLMSREARVTLSPLQPGPAA